jgi:hypothetical protein
MIRDWLKNWFGLNAQDNSLLLAEKEVPPSTGRSSVDEFETLLGGMGSALGFYGATGGTFDPFPFLDFLTKIAPVNPDISHAIANTINLANNGHKLVLAGSDSAVDAAQKRLNEKASTLYPRSAGIDGLINHYLRQILISGAISSEDVVAPGLTGVQEVVVVPAASIRFKVQDGEIIPCQKMRDGSLIELHPTTYRYYAMDTPEGSPYAIPPFAAAVESILTSRDMTENIKFVVRKLGLIGLLGMNLTKPPKKPNETDAEYETRLRKYQNAVVKAMEVNYNKSLMVHFADQNFEHHNVTGDARGASDLYNLNDRKIASGMQTDPVLLGMPTNSTETFANVTYMFLTRRADNIRRLAKRRMERTYSLDLRLAGIPVDDLAFAFNANPARDPLAEAQAEATRSSSIIRQVQVGMVAPDEAAQELGYEEWHDSSLIHSDQPGGVAGDGFLQRRTFKYNRALERYEFKRPRVAVVTAQKTLASEQAVRETIKRFERDYYDAIASYLGDATDEAMNVLRGFLRRSRPSDFRDAEHFAEEAFLLLSRVYQDAFRGGNAQDVLTAQVRSVYEHYRLEDAAAFKKAPEIVFEMDHIDRRTLGFSHGIDRFYLSKWIFNEPTERSIKSYLEDQFIAGGDGIFGRTSIEAIDEFIRLAQDRAEDLTEYEAQRIISTSVQRLRNWGNIGQMSEAGITVAQIYNPSPEAEICKYMTKTVKYLPVAEARDAVDELSQLTPQQFADRLGPVTPGMVEGAGIESATRSGYGFPPYHPNCKTRLLATERDKLGAAATAKDDAIRYATLLSESACNAV